MAFNQSQKLTYLIGLRLTLDILKVDQLGNAGVDEDMVAARSPREVKAEGLDQGDHIVKPNVALTDSELLQQLSLVHCTYLVGHGFDCKTSLSCLGMGLSSFRTSDGQHGNRQVGGSFHSGRVGDLW